MKHVPKKAKLGKPKPIVIKIDPTEQRQGIVLPEVTYKVAVEVEQKEVFCGMVVPIPRVLLYFLNHMELMVVSSILEDSINGEGCALSAKDIGARLKISAPTIHNTFYTLRKLGLLLEQPNGKKGTGKIRKLNYEAIQHLNDLVEDEDASVIFRLRKATRIIDITHLTKESVQAAYDNVALAPDHDPAEEEEYN